MSAESETPPRSLAAVLGDLYLAPGEAFAELARHPRLRLLEDGDAFLLENLKNGALQL